MLLNILILIKDLFILFAILFIWAYVTWNGIEFKLKSGKIDLGFEIYSLKRFFNK